MQLAACQVIGSIGGSMFGPAAVALLSENVSSRRQSTAMGIYGGCEDVGMIIGSALGGVLWSALGPTPTFLLVGTSSAFLGAVIAFAFLRKPLSKRTEMETTLNF
jgi:MFS family permease